MIVAANFKTNNTREYTKTYIDALVNSDARDEIYIFPTFTSLSNAKAPSNVKVGAQNFYPVQNGSFTGEIGQDQLDEFNIKCVLIGHSERRHVLNESEELIKEKYEFAMKNGWKIFYCIGESKEVRESGKVIEYLKNQLSYIDINYENLIVAYEPVWAIGTGISAELKDIDETLNALRELTDKPLLYGGSVKGSNAKEIFSLKNCDGVLVGSASWKIVDFQKILNETN